jgi:leucyl aminopeptidase
MPLALAAELRDPSALDDVDLIGIGVRKLDGELTVVGDVASLGLPTTLDAPTLERRGFDGALASSLVYEAAPGRPTIVLLGLGASDLGDAEAWRKVAAACVRLTPKGRALLVVPDEADSIEAAVVGGLLASYHFVISASEQADAARSFVVTGSDRDALARGRAIAHAVSFARDVINEPPSNLTPAILAKRVAEELAQAPRVAVEVWDEDRLLDEHLGALLKVAAGSHEPPRLVKAVYEPEGEPTRHVLLVGKGITFDSGGLSLKTATGMTTMKTDMTGAAVVLSAMTALASLEVDAKVTALAPMTENMPGGAAMKPGDVLIPRSGPTIEVLNTDAEGRLILADALSLAIEEEPDLIVDVATLTGAAVVALGKGVGALLSNDDDAAQAFIDAGVATGEALWRLPLVDEYESHISSEVADIKNTGATGEAGTISAALFLQRYVDGRSWVHLDIAGPGRSDKDAGYLTKGGTAFSLRTILELLRA